MIGGLTTAQKDLIGESMALYAEETMMHQRTMRLETLKLALDTVVGSSEDRSGIKNCNDVLRVAARYLEYVEGKTAPQAGARPARNAMKEERDDTAAQ